MEVLGYIIAIGFVVFGFISLLKDGREKGGGFVLFEVIGVVILACLGLWEKSELSISSF